MQNISCTPILQPSCFIQFNEESLYVLDEKKKKKKK